MKGQSRREFLNCCACLAVSGAAAVFLPGPAGCEEANTGERTGVVRPVHPSASAASYLELQRSGELKRRGEALWQMMASCQLCPRLCGVNPAQRRGVRDGTLVTK